MSTANFHKFRIFLRPGVQQMPKRQAQKVRGGGICRPRREIAVLGERDEKEDQALTTCSA